MLHIGIVLIMAYITTARKIKEAATNTEDGLSAFGSWNVFLAVASYGRILGEWLSASALLLIFVQVLITSIKAL